MSSWEDFKHKFGLDQYSQPENQINSQSVSTWESYKHDFGLDAYSAPEPIPDPVFTGEREYGPSPTAMGNYRNPVKVPEPSRLTNLPTLPGVSPAAQDSFDRSFQKFQPVRSALQQDAATEKAALDSIADLPKPAKSVFDRYVANKNASNPTPATVMMAAQAYKELMDLGYDGRVISDLAETASRVYNEDKMEKTRQEAAQRTDRGFLPGLWENVKATAKAPVGAITGALDAGDELIRRGVFGSQYRSPDPNLPGYRNSQYVDTVRETSARNIEDQAGKIPGYLYRAGTSAGDSALRLAALGPKGAMLAVGADAFGRGVRDVSQRGGSGTQAALSGAVTAAVETLTEKLPIDTLMGMKNVGSVRDIVSNALRQAGSEIAEEEVGFVADQVADAVIMGDESRVSREINSRIAQGESRKDARKHAFQSLLQEAGETAIVSGLSGSLMGGVNSGVDYYGYKHGGSTNATPATNDLPEQAQTATQGIEETHAPMVNTSNPIDAAIDSLQQTGRVTNSQAEAIINDPRALSTLIDNGMELPGTASGNRAAVKQAVADYVSTYSAADMEEPATLKQSGLYENTYQNAIDDNVKAIGFESLENDPQIAQYSQITEKESVENAKNRLATPEMEQQEYSDLVSKPGWIGEDNDTAFELLDRLRKSGKTDQFMELARKQREQATKGGQFVQSFAKYSHTTTGAATEAVNTMSDYTRQDVAGRFLKGKDLDTWKNEQAGDILGYADKIEAVKPGDAAAMQNIIRDLAKKRKTTAWFGMSDKMTKAAEKMIGQLDYDTAKDIATAQLKQLPNDYRKRSKGEVIKTVRIMNMLSSVPSFGRNIVGNSSIGLMDGFADSTVGACVDRMLSKVTGRRTVASDITQPKAYMQGAREAMKMAALAAELDIPSDAESKYQVGSARTFSPQGGPVSRYMSALEKYLSYALDVTDEGFAGGSEAATNSALSKLQKNGNLTPEEMAAVAKEVGQRRTFKEERKLSKTAKDVKKSLNNIGIKDFGLGDAGMPFVGVPSNLAHTAIDYNSGGVEGMAEVFKLVKKAKQGQYISAVEQSKAVRDTARGITGIGLISLMTVLAGKGVIAAHDEKDRDKRNLDLSKGLNGAQFNVDAAIRAMNGEDTARQDGDTLVNINFLEPFTSQIYLGYALSQEYSIKDAIEQYPKHTAAAIAKSLLNMPLMQTVQDITDIFSAVTKGAAEEDPDAVKNAIGKAAGNQASSLIPAWMRQAAQVKDPYYRDTNAQDSVLAAVNRLMAGLPKASEKLPVQYNGLGEPQRRYEEGEDLLGFLNTAVLPGKVNKYKANKIAAYLDDLAEETGNKSIYPDTNTPTTYYDGKSYGLIFGKKNIEAYKKTYGESVSRFYGDLIELEEFDDLDSESKIETLNKAKAYAEELATKAADPAFHLSKEYESLDDVAPDLLYKENKKLSGMSDAQYSKATDAKFSDDEIRKTATAVNGLLDKVKDPTDYDKYSAVVDTVPADQAASWLKVYGMTDNQLTGMQEAKRAGVSAKSYVYGLHANSLLESAFDKKKAGKKDESDQAVKHAQDILKQLPATAKKYLEDNLATGQEKKYLEMTRTGMTNSAAVYVAGMLQGVQKMADQLDRISSTSMSEKDKQTAVYAYMDDKQDAKFSAIIDMGFDTEDYVDLYKTYIEEHGSGKKKRVVEEYQWEFGIDKGTAEAIYKLYSGH